MTNDEHTQPDAVADVMQAAAAGARRRLTPAEDATALLLTTLACERDAARARVAQLERWLQRCLDALEHKPGDGVTVAEAAEIRALAQADAGAERAT